MTEMSLQRIDFQLNRTESSLNWIFVHIFCIFSLFCLFAWYQFPKLNMTLQFFLAFVKKTNDKRNKWDFAEFMSHSHFWRAKFHAKPHKSLYFFSEKYQPLSLYAFLFSKPLKMVSFVEPRGKRCKFCSLFDLIKTFCLKQNLLSTETYRKISANNEETK